MSLIDLNQIHNKLQGEKNKNKSPYNPLLNQQGNTICIGEPYETLKEHIGIIEQNQIINFWTFGRYAMHHVLKHILQQIGHADIIACTWAISKPAVEDILFLDKKGYVDSFKLWIDPRVKVRNPEPLSMLKLKYPIAISPVHAKVTLISNSQWKISIFGSLNFTTSPQPERGCICTIPSVYDADYKILKEATYEQFN